MEGEYYATAYLLHAWDCPYCGYQNVTDCDLAGRETCEDCQQEVGIVQ